MKNIILLHGAIGASDQLVPLSEALEKLGYTTFLFDFSGHGTKPFTNGFGITAFAEELRQFINDNKLIKPHVFGYSMGGYVALYLASQQPELLGKIITLGTKFDWSPEIAAKEIKMLDSKTIIEKVPKFAEALQKRHGGRWEQVLQRTSNMMLELGENNLLIERLPNISCKSYLGLAHADTMVTKEETFYVAERLNGAEFFVIENAKHPIETVNPEDLSGKISQFLS